MPRGIGKYRSVGVDMNAEKTKQDEISREVNRKLAARVSSDGNSLCPIFELGLRMVITFENKKRFT